MQQYHFLYALDSGVVDQLLPLGDSIIGAFLTLGTALITYTVGRAKARAEVDNLQAEKKNIEAASGVSTAEAAKIISAAAAATVEPLMDRLKEQRQEISHLNSEAAEARKELEIMRDHVARLSAENKLMKQKFRLQGESPPELPPEVMG
jgi:uncharacterized coiled-coil protein SlyX